MARAALIAFLILAGVVSRLIPHPPNVTAVTAIALVSGLYLGGRSSIFIPLGAMIVSDLLIGFHGIMGFVYVGFVLVVLMGSAFRDSQRGVVLAGGSIAGSTIFFVVTNAGVWLAGSGIVYPKTLEGLLACYVAALPFFRNALVGDLLYTGLFAVVFETAILAGLWRLPSALHR